MNTTSDRRAASAYYIWLFTCLAGAPSSDVPIAFVFTLSVHTYPVFRFRRRYIGDSITNLDIQGYMIWVAYIAKVEGCTMFLLVAKHGKMKALPSQIRRTWSSDPIDTEYIVFIVFTDKKGLDSPGAEDFLRNKLTQIYLLTLHCENVQHWATMVLEPLGRSNDPDQSSFGHKAWKDSENLLQGWPQSALCY